jgi:hypothetical protein
MSSEERPESVHAPDDEADGGSASDASVPETTPAPVAVADSSRVATILAWVSLPLLAASALLFLLPVSNPGVEDCGSPIVSLLQAQPDRPLIDADGTAINGWGPKRLEQAQEQSCEHRVAQRAVPAGILLVSFWLVAGVALLLHWVDRAKQRARIRAASLR